MSFRRHGLRRCGAIGRTAATHRRFPAAGGDVLPTPCAVVAQREQKSLRPAMVINGILMALLMVNNVILMINSDY